jgi:hypothetical protein
MHGTLECCRTRPHGSTLLRALGASASDVNLRVGTPIGEPPLRSPAGMIVSMTRSSARSEMNESEMAALLLKAQEEERLGQVIRCDDAEAVRELFADIRAHRV